MRALLLGAALVAAATQSGASSEIDPTFFETDLAMGQPSRIVAPDYPMVALMDKKGGVVEVSARVSPFGLLEAAKVSAVPPTDEAFAAAVRDVLENWIFYVPTDKQCQPDPRPVTTRVEFSAEDGKPHVSIFRPAAPKSETAAHFKATYRVNPDFPRRALEEGIAGTVFARVDVNARGEVSEVFARAYSTRESGVLRSLESATRSALLSWRYPPPPEGRPWAGCYVIHFRFRD